MVTKASLPSSKKLGLIILSTKTAHDSAIYRNVKVFREVYGGKEWFLFWYNTINENGFLRSTASFLGMISNILWQQAKRSCKLRVNHSTGRWSLKSKYKLCLAVPACFFLRYDAVTAGKIIWLHQYFQASLLFSMVKNIGALKAVPVRINITTNFRIERPSGRCRVDWYCELLATVTECV